MMRKLGAGRGGEAGIERGLRGCVFRVSEVNNVRGPDPSTSLRCAQDDKREDVLRSR